MKSKLLKNSFENYFRNHIIFYSCTLVQETKFLYTVG